MDTAIDDVLKDIGWSSGFHLPVANDENKVLEKELAALVLRKSKATVAFEDTGEKLQNLQNHMKFVLQETTQNENLILAYRQQVDNERHKFKLAEREKDNLNSTLRQANKSIEDIEDRQDSKRKDLARHLQRLEKIKAEATWDTEALKAWEDSLKKRDLDNELLKKFSVEDQRHAGELEAKRLMLQSEVNDKANILVKMNLDISNSEYALTRTGKIIKQMAEERSALVRQWHESVKNLRQRDVDINRLNKEIEDMQELISKKKEILNDKNDFLAGEKNNNKFLEMQIGEDNNLNSRIRAEMTVAVDECALMFNETHSRKKAVESAAHELEMQRRQTKNLKQEISEVQHKNAVIHRELDQLNKKYKQSVANIYTGAARIREIEHALEKSQNFKKSLLVDLNTLQEVEYKKRQEMDCIKEEFSKKQSELLTAEVTLSTIRKRFKKSTQMLIHKRQILSDQEVKVACLEAKLGNLEGQLQVEEDALYWTAQIIELENSLSEQTEVKTLLRSQILKLQKETLRLISITSADDSKHRRLKDKLQECVLMVEGGIKQTAAAKSRTQQKQVDENVLKLKVDKLSKAMSREDKEIYNLQRYRLELETVMRERQIETQASTDILLAKRRNLDEERGRLRADISIRKLRISQFQNKYELALGLLGKDDNGSPINMTTFKIKNAQEKYMLQQEGDDLDQKVRKAESEIIAMENTLKIVNMTNSTFKHSLDTVDRDGLEVEQKEELETEIRNNNLELCERKRYFVSKQECLKELDEKLKELDKMRGEIKTELNDKQDLFAKLDREAEDRQDKINRSQRQINSCKKNISNAHLDKYDRDLYIRQLQDTNKTILHHLADFSLQNPEVRPVLDKYILDYQLELPRIRTSFSSISSDSIQSFPSKSSPMLTVPCSVTSIEMKFGEVCGKPKGKKNSVKKF